MTLASLLIGEDRWYTYITFKRDNLFFAEFIIIKTRVPKELNGKEKKVFAFM